MGSHILIEMSNKRKKRLQDIQVWGGRTKHQVDYQRLIPDDPFDAYQYHRAKIMDKKRMIKNLQAEIEKLNDEIKEHKDRQTVIHRVLVEKKYDSMIKYDQEN